MGVLFYNYGDKGMLMHSVGSSAAPASMDLFDGLVGKEFLTIITQINITMTDTHQFFMTFDDFIHHYFFGKGIGSISVNGMLFQNCDEGQLPGIDEMYNIVGAKRGTRCVCSIGKTSFVGVLTDLQLSMVSEPETMAQFSANFAMVDHFLPPPPQVTPFC